MPSERASREWIGAVTSFSGMAAASDHPVDATGAKTIQFGSLVL